MMRKKTQNSSVTGPCAMQRGAVRLIAVVLAVCACGCHIPNKAYRAQKPIIEVETPPDLPMKPHTAWPKHPEDPCDEKDLRKRPCLAFLEFDEFGESWERKPSGRPEQLDRVRNLIYEAKRQDPTGQPLILAFIHGWKHNASYGGDEKKKSGADDSNIIGLAATLNELSVNQWKNHVIIGIYISWRGGLVSPYWPVAQQFTYWDREATAIRVGNTSLTESLIEISDAAHAGFKCEENEGCWANSACRDLDKKTQVELDQMGQSCSPILLYVGHSFGALVLERAISQAMVTRLEREWDEQRAVRTRAEALAKVAKDAKTAADAAAEAEKKSAADATATEDAKSAARAAATSKGAEAAKANCRAECAAVDTTTSLQFTPLANLIIFVNSAAAATESKQMMDYLASSKFTYEPSNRGQDEMPAGSQPRDDRPLFLSVTSESDSATGVFLKVGHSVPWLTYKFHGSMRSTDPPPKSEDQDTRYARACFEPQTGVAGIKFDVSQSDYYFTTTAHKQQLWSHIVNATKAPEGDHGNPSCERQLPSASGIFEKCRIGQMDYEVKPSPGRCNGTPYWVLQVQKEIVPDHNTIFTNRLIAFLTPFIPTPSDPGEVLRPLLIKPGLQQPEAQQK